jgi:hypothetical protein
MQLDGRRRIFRGGLLTKGAKFAFAVVFAGKADICGVQDRRQETDYEIDSCGHGLTHSPGEAADGDCGEAGELR